MQGGVEGMGWDEASGFVHASGRGSSVPHDCLRCLPGHTQLASKMEAKAGGVKGLAAIKQAQPQSDASLCKVPSLSRRSFVPVGGCVPVVSSAVLLANVACCVAFAGRTSSDSGRRHSRSTASWCATGPTSLPRSTSGSCATRVRGSGGGCRPPTTLFTAARGIGLPLLLLLLLPTPLLPPRVLLLGLLLLLPLLLCCHC